MMRVKLLFGEVEHEGDLDECRLAVSRAGARVVGAGFRTDDEEGWVVAETDEPRAVDGLLREDESACYDGMTRRV